VSGPREPVAVPLPMFPLGAVLFPHMPLALHVFEDRYRALVRDCLRHGHEFGVVLIERGAEVGGGDSRFGLGTVARIVEAVPFPDGRWELLCLGARRVKVVTWLPDDPYPLALVEDRPELPLGEGAKAALDRATAEVRRSLALAGELGEAPFPASVQLADDPLVAAHQLAAIAPLGPVDQQRILEIDEPEERLGLLRELAAEAAGVLAFRLSGT
jgi:uncharacterized protein